MAARGLALWLMFCLWAFPGTTSAGTEGSGFGSAQELIQAVENRTRDVKTLTCSIYQVKHLKMFSRPVEFSGHLYLARPDKLRWEFTSPIPSVLVLDGHRMLRCTSRSGQVEFDMNKNPVMAAVAVQLWSWVNGMYGKLAEIYRIELNGEAGPGLTLIPIDSTIARAVSRIDISFDPGTLQAQKVEVRERGGDLTELHFSDFRFNQPLEPELFSKCTP